MEYKKPKVRTYRDMVVYQKSFALAMDVFRLTAEFPKEERYGLTDQLRRAARSMELVAQTPKGVIARSGATKQSPVTR